MITTRRAKAVRSAIPSALTLALLASRLAAVPALTDPVAGTLPPSLHLSVPYTYLLLAPLFTTWDGISMLSMSRLEGFLIGVLVLYLIWRVVHHVRAKAALTAWKTWVRELGVLVFSLSALLLFLVVGAVWHRPVLSLAGTSPGALVADFHSHTNRSHDVGGTWMRHFDLAANLRWHARAGFDAAFITDHNEVSRESRVESRGARGAESGDGVAVCPGTEVSAWRSHIVLLGDTLPVDRSRYDGLTGLIALLRTSESAYGSLSLASLPEYRRNHWGRLDTLVAAGLDGFEIVNASPKANELTLGERDRVIDLARRNNRFVAGVSDSHGWGATSMVWNLVQIPAAESGDTCARILQHLRTGFGSVRVIERHRLRPDDAWPLWLTPLGMLWETWRSMGWELTISWLLWIWLFWAGSILLRTRLLKLKIANRSASS